MGSQVILRPKRRSAYLGEAGLKSSREASIRLPLRGGEMSGALNMGRWQINNMKDGVASQDAATINNLNAVAKHLWSPVTTCSLSAVISPPTLIGGGYSGASLANLGDYAGISFYCPDGFTSIGEASIVVSPRATQAAANWDIYVTFATNGELETTHQANNTATTYNVTNNTLLYISITTLLSGMAQDDVVGIQFLQQDNAHDVDVIGFYMTYT